MLNRFAVELELATVRVKKPNHLGDSVAVLLHTRRNVVVRAQQCDQERRAMRQGGVDGAGGPFDRNDGEIEQRDIMNGGA